ncbi:uncharacterized protein LOC116850410 [Odontomachus brunneus]|uniref:uncharacterized protein LOC116850410 n=1 Tax=Odontomachus brunneus TaxID=486640 RepID=UPI0013F1DB64|nr:uncharacterized protein LOC116850410 [Odontomachus brunneus]
MQLRRMRFRVDGRCSTGGFGSGRAGSARRIGHSRIWPILSFKFQTWSGSCGHIAKATAVSADVYAVPEDPVRAGKGRLEVLLKRYVAGPDCESFRYSHSVPGRRVTRTPQATWIVVLTIVPLHGQNIRRFLGDLYPCASRIFPDLVIQSRAGGQHYRLRVSCTLSVVSFG